MGGGAPGLSHRPRPGGGDPRRPHGGAGAVRYGAAQRRFLRRAGGLCRRRHRSGRGGILPRYCHPAGKARHFGVSGLQAHSGGARLSRVRHHCDRAAASSPGGPLAVPGGWSGPQGPGRAKPPGGIQPEIPGVCPGAAGAGTRAAGGLPPGPGQRRGLLLYEGRRHPGDPPGERRGGGGGRRYPSGFFALPGSCPAPWWLSAATTPSWTSWRTCSIRRIRAPL